MDVEGIVAAMAVCACLAEGQPVAYGIDVKLYI
jgi:hypothetical protein